MGIVKFIVKFFWELPSNVVGFLLMFFVGLEKMEFDKEKGILIATMDYTGGMTMGVFIFIGREDRNLLPHEYGHIRQGWVCGPLYLLIIGLPSLIWCMVYKKTGKPYDWFYTERWLMDKK